MKFNTAVISEIGKRPYLEDTYSLAVNPKKSEIFGAVYDGHGGKSVAEFARENIPKVFYAELKKGTNPQRAFVQAYKTTDKNIPYQGQGATAATFFIKESMLFYAHVGDARLIVIGDYGVKQLTKDHRLTNPAEKKRIEERNGLIIPPYVVKENEGLMPTRTLGDKFFQDVGIISTPDVGEYQLSKKDQWILAGTDGVFDVIDNNSIAFLIKSQKKVVQAAQVLKEEILIKIEGSDNFTFILIKID